MKEHCKVFAVAKKMPILAEADTDVGSQASLASMHGLLVSTLITMVSQWSEIETSYSCCGSPFSKELKNL